MLHRPPLGHDEPIGRPRRDQHHLQLSAFRQPEGDCGDLADRLSLYSASDFFFAVFHKASIGQSSRLIERSKTAPAVVGFKRKSSGFGVEQAQYVMERGHLPAVACDQYMGVSSSHEPDDDPTFDHSGHPHRSPGIWLGHAGPA